VFSRQKRIDNPLEFLKKVERRVNKDLVNFYMTIRGNGQEFINVILTNVNYLLLLSTIVLSFKHNQYLLAITAIIYFISFFVENLIGLVLNAISTILIVVFTLQTRYYLILILLGVLFISNYTNTYLRKRNILLLIKQNKPVINYFEGFDNTGFIVLISIFFILALSSTGIFSIIMWIILGVIFLFHLSFCYNRLYPFHHRIHYSLMFRYARIAARKMNENENFDFYDAAKSLLFTVDFRDNDEIDKHFERAVNRMETFCDYSHFLDFLSSKYSREVSQEILDEIRDYVASEKGKRYIINYSIGEVVESVFGKQERINYLVDVFLGKVS